MGVAVHTLLHEDTRASGSLLEYAYRLHKSYLSGIVYGGLSDRFSGNCVPQDMTLNNDYAVLLYGLIYSRKLFSIQRQRKASEDHSWSQHWNASAMNNREWLCETSLKRCQKVPSRRKK